MESLVLLGRYITRRRDFLRLRQKGLATLSGISDATLRAIETGKPGVAIQNWIKVADILGLEMVLQTKKMSDETRKSME